jgi:hypothetical protein
MIKNFQKNTPCLTTCPTTNFVKYEYYKSPID